MRMLPPGLYGLDDLRPGDRWSIGRRVITTALIDAFAEMTGDRFEIHMDATAAARHGFPARVAHGLLVLSVIDGLKNQAPVQLAAIASLGWDWSFRAPVLADTTVQGHVTITDTRATKTPERGIATLSFDITDANGALLQQGTNALMMYRQTSKSKT